MVAIAKSKPMAERTSAWRILTIRRGRAVLRRYHDDLSARGRSSSAWRGVSRYRVLRLADPSAAGVSSCVEACRFKLSNRRIRVAVSAGAFVYPHEQRSRSLVALRCCGSGRRSPAAMLRRCGGRETATGPGASARTQGIRRVSLMPPAQVGSIMT